MKCPATERGLKIMQRYRIFHRTYYQFSGEVSLGPHQLRLRPREDHELRIESLQLKIEPDAALLWRRDIEGNSVAAATFVDRTGHLLIESEAIIQQYLEDPLDFLVDDYAIVYPLSYRPDDLALLAPYIATTGDGFGDTWRQWFSNFWQQGESIQTYTLLQRLNRYIHQSLSYRVREEPGVQTAQETLASGTGSCRDYAQLFMAATGYLGLASRFVSGYLHTPLSNAIGATHAWAEVYLPGAGWRGFDPTIGDMVGADHIAVAVARLPESVPPIGGSFVGTPGSRMEVGVWVGICS